jgi:hypothetical protein
VFFNRVGLTREQRLVDEEVPRLQHQAICGHQVACRQQHHIARHQRTDRAFAGPTIAQHRGAHHDRLTQLLGSTVGTVLLHKIQRDAHQDDAADDGEVDRIARQRRDATGRQQNQDQRISEMRQVLPDQGPLTLLAKTVRPKAAQALLGLCSSQALGLCGLVGVCPHLWIGPPLRCIAYRVLCLAHGQTLKGSLSFA